MGIKMHRTCSLYCNRPCQAIEGYGESRKWCSLGYKTSLKNRLEMIPLEPCPKPITNAETYEAWEHFRKSQVRRDKVKDDR